MSDKTPDSEEFDELAENESAEELEAEEGEVATTADADAVGDLEPDAASAAAGVPRRTAKAPVRKKDLAPEADDAEIAVLEENFSDEENAAASQSVRVARKTAKAPVKKDVATRKRSEAHHEEVDHYRAKNPAEFVSQSAGELKQVVWPTWPQLVSYFTAVLVFVVFFIAFIGLLDLLFGWGLLTLFGDNR